MLKKTMSDVLDIVFLLYYFSTIFYILLYSLLRYICLQFSKCFILNINKNIVINLLRCKLNFIEIQVSILIWRYSHSYLEIHSLCITYIYILCINIILGLTFSHSQVMLFLYGIAVYNDTNCLDIFIIQIAVILYYMLNTFGPDY